MKTVYITEDAMKAITRSMSVDVLPDDILSALRSKKTSLGNNPAIPDIFDEPFLERVSNRRYGKVRQEVKKWLYNETTPTEEMVSYLNQLVHKCQEHERPLKNELEKICYNAITHLFNIPEDLLDIKVELTDTVSPDTNTIHLEPSNGDDEMEFADLMDANSLKADIYKRRMLDCLIMGAAMKYSSGLKSVYDHVSRIDSELPNLYRQITTLNDYLMFRKEDLGLDDRNMKQMGVVYVRMGDDIKKTTIFSQGMIFPVLLCETIRGFMELFISHGLPQSRSRAETVLDRADFLKAEPWDMRLGPELWEMFSNVFEKSSTDILPYVLSTVSRLPVHRFNHFFNEVFAQTRKGNIMAGSVMHKARREKEEDSTGTFVNPNNNTKTVISDEVLMEEL